MQPRQIAIAAAVIVGAFVLAFVAGKAAGGGGSSAEAVAAPVGKVIEVPAAGVSANLNGERLPELREVKPKATPTPSSAPESTPFPTTPPTATPPPSSPPPSPPPSSPPPSQTPGPIVGGGET
jgi:hypothetical protein